MTVVYSNKQYPVNYYLNGKVVMNSMEYCGFTVDVKPYEKGGMTAADWYTMDAIVEDGKFVMPNGQVNLSNLAADGLEPVQKEDAPESMATGLAIAVLAIAAVLVLLNFRRH